MNIVLIILLCTCSCTLSIVSIMLLCTCSCTFNIVSLKLLSTCMVSPRMQTFHSSARFQTVLNIVRIIMLCTCSCTLNIVSIMYLCTCSCTFHTVGTAAGEQKFNSLCILSLNIINEKVRIFHHSEQSNEHSEQSNGKWFLLYFV